MIAQMNASNKRIRHQRSQSGVAIILIVMALSFLILGGVGLFAYEISRSNSARDELRSACEAAALAGVASLASSNATDPATAHDNAEQAAQQTFVCNTILGNLLADTTFTNNKTSTATAAGTADPALNEAVLYVEFLKLDGTVAKWDDPAGRYVHVIGAFAEEPNFAKFLGIPKATVYADTKGKVPKMDIILCFDVSSSIDDQTRVSFVKRWWNPATAKIQYDIAKNGNGITANGSIYSILMPQPRGSSVDIERPQGLDSANAGVNGADTPLTFDKDLRMGPSGKDSGEPPSNYPNSGTAAGADRFTDMVANLNGKDIPTFPFTYQADNGTAWQFPTLGAVVEAARGNLEDATVFASSHADSTLSGQVTPTKGYQAAYFEAAHKLAMPIGAARTAAIQFLTVMNNNADITLGLVGIGNSPPSKSPTNMNGTTEAIAGNYPAGGKITPPYPGQSLGAGTFNTIINNVIPLTLANGGTCIGEAADEAVTELLSNGRTGAQKAIVVFTDGQQNGGSVNWSTAATRAHENGIAIYTVGFAQNSAIIPGECDTLNDDPSKTITYTDPITGAGGSYTPSGPGMAAIAGFGGKFFLVTKVDDLNFVFENIARQLVQLSQS